MDAEFVITLIIFIGFVGYIAYKSISTTYNFVKGATVVELWNDSGVKVVTTFFSCLLVIFVVYLLNPPGKAITHSHEQRDNSTMAHIQCKEFVKERLKAPSSADFAFLDYTATKLTDNQYVIRSYVDAQNSFGAKLRNSYTCSVKWNGSSDNDIRNWELVSLQIDQ